MTSSLDDENYDDNLWQRLKCYIADCKRLTIETDRLKANFDEDSPCSQNVIAQNMAASIQEKEVKCEKMRRKIEKIHLLMASKRRQIHEVNDKLTKKKDDLNKLALKIEELEKKSNANDVKKVDNEILLKSFTKLLAFRKIYMVQEVLDIYKVEIDGGPASNQQPNRDKRECKCVLIDTIRGLHLPHATSILAPGHCEIETNAAAGYIIHALDAICTIIDYSLRYPIVPAQSLSKVYHPLENKSILLNGLKKRLDREKFVEGIVLLGKNIAQLRADCGIPTPIADKTLSVLAEWVRSINGGTYVCIFERPTQSLFSPASLLLNNE